MCCTAPGSKTRCVTPRATPYFSRYAPTPARLWRWVTLTSIRNAWNLLQETDGLVYSPICRRVALRNYILEQILSFFSLISFILTGYTGRTKCLKMHSHFPFGNKDIFDLIVADLHSDTVSSAEHFIQSSNNAFKDLLLSLFINTHILFENRNFLQGLTPKHMQGAPPCCDSTCCPFNQLLTACRFHPITNSQGTILLPNSSVKS